MALSENENENVAALLVCYFSFSVVACLFVIYPSLFVSYILKGFTLY